MVGPKIYHLRHARAYSSYSPQDLSKTMELAIGWWRRHNFNIKRTCGTETRGCKRGLHVNFTPKFEMRFEQDNTTGRFVVWLEYYAKIKLGTLTTVGMITLGTSTLIGIGTLGYALAEADRFTENFWVYIDSIAGSAPKVLVVERWAQDSRGQLIKQDAPADQTKHDSPQKARHSPPQNARSASSPRAASPQSLPPPPPAIDSIPPPPPHAHSPLVQHTLPPPIQPTVSAFSPLPPSPLGPGHVHVYGHSQLHTPQSMVSSLSSPPHPNNNNNNNNNINNNQHSAPQGYQQQIQYPYSTSPTQHYTQPHPPSHLYPVMGPSTFSHPAPDCNPLVAQYYYGPSTPPNNYHITQRPIPTTF